MIPKPFKTLAYSTALSALLAGGALAQTAPGTPVNNTITLEYQTGAGTITLTGNDLPTANFIVDRKIDLGLRSTQSTEAEITAPGGSEQVVLAFELENNGNGTQDFKIEVTRTGDLNLALSSSATDTPAAGEYSVVFSTTNDLSGLITPHTANVENLAAGASIFVLIVANIPLDADDNLADDFTVMATALTETGGDINYTRLLGLMDENVIAVDTASNSTLTPATPVSVADDGIDVDQGRIRVSTPMITASKDVIVISEDPTFACSNIDANGDAQQAEAGAFPGACIEYTITVENTAQTAAATNVVIEDKLQSVLTYQSHSPIVYTVITDGTAGSGTTATGPIAADGTINVTIGNLPAGERATFRIRATIN